MAMLGGDEVLDTEHHLLVLHQVQCDMAKGGWPGDDRRDGGDGWLLGRCGLLARLRRVFGLWSLRLRLLWFMWEGECGGLRVSCGRRCRC